MNRGVPVISDLLFSFLPNLATYCTKMGCYCCLNFVSRPEHEILPGGLRPGPLITYLGLRGSLITHRGDPSSHTW